MRDVLDLVERHNEWRLKRCLNLVPSENVTSEHVRAILGSDLAHRYTLPWGQEWQGYFVENSYRGTRYLDEIESLGERLARDVFSARHATLKPLSGHLAGMLTLISTCRRGDAILVLAPRPGVSHRKQAAPPNVPPWGRDPRPRRRPRRVLRMPLQCHGNRSRHLSMLSPFRRVGVDN